MNNKIGIVIPWRPQPSRLDGFNYVLDWYKENLPEATIYLADRPGIRWSMSGSRNDGVRMAEADGCDIIIMNDADTVAQIDSLRFAITEARSNNLINNPYTEYCALHYFPISKIRQTKNLEELSHERYDFSCSGVNVFKPSTWWSIGGADEKFIGWGYEDDAMRRAHQVITGHDYVRVEGLVFSIAHKRQPSDGDKNFENNKSLFFDRYQKTHGKDEMLNLVTSKQ